MTFPDALHLERNGVHGLLDALEPRFDLQRSSVVRVERCHLLFVAERHSNDKHDGRNGEHHGDDDYLTREIHGSTLGIDFDWYELVIPTYDWDRTEVSASP